MWVDTIYDLTMNVPLYHIHHIGNADIFWTQYKIATKRLSAINTVSTYELSSTTKR